VHNLRFSEFFANRGALIDFDEAKWLNRKSALFLGKDWIKEVFNDGTDV